jgi:hypothetical protein
MKATEQLVAFFKMLPHNNDRVAGWYTPDMEVQVLVSQGEGEPASDKQGVYCGNNFAYEWYNFRLPKNANSDPIDNDHELRYPLERHVDYIGLTGWDWRNKKSIRCGFDFDSITSHAKGVGIEAEQLNIVLSKLMDIPEALVLKSTSGTGLHVYLEFDPENLPTTNNHTEHAALALACLKEISRKVEFNFEANMDVGGGNMWVWARKMTLENQGLTTLKDNKNSDCSQAYLTPPTNWEAYIDVAERRRSKVRIEGVEESDQDTVASKAAAQRNTPLDDTHKRIIAELQQFSNITTYWVADHHLLNTHTAALKRLFESRQAAGDPILGAFETLSEGKDLAKPNCFLFPIENGGFRACRFGKRTTEHPLWKQDKSGWTYCYYNKPLTLDGAASAFDGLEDDIKGGGYTFPNGLTASTALRAMGHSIEIPTELTERKVRIQPHKEKMLIEIVRTHKDDIDPVGWLQKKGKFYRIFNIDLRVRGDVETDFEEIDKHVRCLISSDSTTSGWACMHERGNWIFTVKDDARSRLKAAGYEDNTEVILGEALSKAWMITHVPFQDEFPGDRQWNLKAPKLKFKPEPYEPGDSPHPHWDMILEHTGADLNANLKDLDWAQKNGIYTGRDYLLLWIALMIREPFEHLPYLYLWSPSQNTGKSILHQAIGTLMQGGVMRADSALTNSGDFNGELAGAVLCVVEEKNISQNATSVYNKIKDLVTSDTIAIHAKYKQVCVQPNTTHWIQCANNRDSCPVFSGDTRVTMIYVDQLVHEIPTHIMLTKLEEEAPYFMYTLMNIALPDVEHRLRLPVVNTSSKEQLIDANKNALENFIDEVCFVAPGLTVPLDAFMSAFLASLAPTEASYWNRSTVVGVLPPQFPVGKVSDNKKFIGNLSFTPPVEKAVGKYVPRHGYLVLET